MKFLMKKAPLPNHLHVHYSDKGRQVCVPGKACLLLAAVFLDYFIQLARALGAGRIFAVDITEYRLKAAKKVGGRCCNLCQRRCPCLYTRN